MNNTSKTDSVDIKPASKVLLDQSDSAAARYRALTTGHESFLYFLMYELATFFLNGMAGAIGLWLRRKLMAPFFAECGPGVVIGRHCTIRHPSRIRLGENVVIDDFCVIDARGTDKAGLSIGDRTILNRGTQIVSKGGDIEIGRECGIGSASNIVSWSGLRIGNGVGIAANCVISAGTYSIDQMSKPREQRRATSSGPIEIGDHCWIATRVTILDGVTIGEDVVVSAGAVVRNDIPPRSVAHGNPAKVVFTLRD